LLLLIKMCYLKVANLYSQSGKSRKYFTNLQEMYKIFLSVCLMFQVFFFMISSKILCKNPFNLFSYFFYKITKMKAKSFECPKAIKRIKKNNTWNIRLLGDDSFVPSSKQPSVIYCRLTDFRTGLTNQLRASQKQSWLIIEM
jgi:hypothetical protein